jgi:hypothetical protein
MMEVTIAMPKKISAKAQEKANNDRISRLYATGCHGVQISIWDMSGVLKVGHEGIAAGLDDDALRAKIVAHVETIRMN